MLAREGPCNDHGKLAPQAAQGWPIDTVSWVRTARTRCGASPVRPYSEARQPPSTCSVRPLT